MPVFIFAQSQSIFAWLLAQVALKIFLSIGGEIRRMRVIGNSQRLAIHIADHEFNSQRTLPYSFYRSLNSNISLFSQRGLQAVYESLCWLFCWIDEFVVF